MIFRIEPFILLEISPYIISYSLHYYIWLEMQKPYFCHYAVCRSKNALVIVNITILNQ